MLRAMRNPASRVVLTPLALQGEPNFTQSHIDLLEEVPAVIWIAHVFGEPIRYLALRVPQSYGCR